MSRRITLNKERFVSIYLSRSVPVEELYYDCNGNGISAIPVEVKATDSNGSEESGEMMLSRTSKNTPQPVSMNTAALRRFRRLTLSNRRDNIELDINFYWKHGSNGFASLDFSIVQW